MEHLTTEQVQHVARLSRLEFTEDELSRFARHLNAILEYMEKLNELDTSGVPPSSHAVKTENIFREDVPLPSLDVQDVLANAPDREDQFFKVPKIIQDTE